MGEPCKHGRSDNAMALGYAPCPREAEPGRLHCAYHLAKFKEHERKKKARGWVRPEERPSAKRPDWMDNPALLPKAPPGRKAASLSVSNTKGEP